MLSSRMPRFAWPRWRLALAACVVVTTCWLPRAHGQSAATEARRLFEVGAKAYADGHHEQAISAFERAYAQTQRPGLLFSLAQAHRAAYEGTRSAAHREAAVDYYSRYLREAPAGQNLDVAGQRLQELRAETQPHASAPPPAETARKSGVTTARPAEPTSTRPSDAAQPDSATTATPRRVAGWALLGGGAATILAGGALGYVALRHDQEATRLDQQEPENAREYNAAARSRDDFRLAAIITASAGAAAAITGVLTLLLDSAGAARSLEPQPGGGSPHAKTVGSWQPAAVLGREGFRLELSGSF